MNYSSLIGTWRLEFNLWQGHWCDFFSLPLYPDRIWGAPILLCNG